MDTLEAIFTWLRRFVVEWVQDNQWALIVAALAVARTFGTVVEEGWRGVLFSFGRVKKELDPGFHWLAPVVHHVRKVRIRSVTLDLPPQRITTRDGLAYDVDANVVYHIEHPGTAAVQIDDVHEGCRVVIPLVIALLLQEQTSQQLADRSRLDAEFADRLQTRLRRWGLVVEHAGLRSIAPTRETLRITQVRARCEERARLYGALLRETGSEIDALALLGAAPRLMDKSAAHYRGYRRRFAVSRRFASLVHPETPRWKVGDRVWANWWELGEFYPGVVTKIDGENFHIQYDDGDDEVVDIRNVRRAKPS